MDISDYPANWRWEGDMANWASREVGNTQMDFKQWGSWLEEVRLARYLTWRRVA